MVEDGLNRITAAHVVGKVGVGLVDVGDVVAGYLFAVSESRVFRPRGGQANYG